MKIVFLDVDGVLNHLGCKEKTPRGFYFVEDEFLERLKKIVHATGAQIVLSTTWRQGFYDLENGETTGDAQDYLLLKEKLREYGITIFGHTPILKEGHRGKEILKWLEEHDELDIEAMVILDDSTKTKPLEQYQVRTFFSEGLRTRHVIRAIAALNHKSLPIMQEHMPQKEDKGDK